MGQVLQTNGDYTIKTVDGGTVSFDTGPTGKVSIVGNLLVEGTSTTVDVENLEISDNIIVVNKGELGPGVTLTYAGLKVDRGFFPDSSRVPPVSIVWDEINKSWAFYSGPEDSFSVDANSKLTVREIRADPDSFNGNLLFNVQTGVLEVPNSIAYENRVTEDFHIPNKRYVDQSILNNPSFLIKSPQDNGIVIIADKNIPSPDPGNPTLGSLEFHEALGYLTYGESVTSVIVDNKVVGQFFSNRLELGDLELGGGSQRNEITSRAGITNENIFVRTQGVGKLQTNYALQLDQISSPPGLVYNSTVIYGKKPGVGTSGVWFVNDSDTVNHRDGELISKNKALVFSMIF